MDINNSSQDDSGTAAPKAARRSMKVGTKVYALAGLCLLMLVGVAGFSIWQMSKIGIEIEGIAERDIPLTESLTKIKVHQLEQAVYFERGFRRGEQMQAQPDAREEFEKVAKKFGELSTSVQAEISDAEIRSQHAIDTAETATVRAEFEKILAGLKHAETAHAAYEKHALESFEHLRSGYTASALAMLPNLEVEEQALDKELNALLEEIEAFTLNAAVLAEAHEKSALQILMILSATALFLGAAISYFIVARSISRPLAAVVVGLDALTSGDTTVEVKVFANDEIGSVARAFGIFRDNMVRTKEERIQMLNQLADEFDASVGNIVTAVSEASDELGTTAQAMASISEETSTQAVAVSSASEQAAANVQTVAASAEEMSHSINEVNRRVTETTEATQQAVAEVANASEQMSTLAHSADKIGDVVKMISGIAEQTNLLALNATIESARAGESGKGFAVVANEVKELASQTGRATEDISAQIQDMQTITSGAVEAMENIQRMITSLEETTSATAVAMEQQSAATQDIARNVQEAAEGTQSVTENVTSVTEASQEAGAASAQVMSKATDLSQQSGVLKTEVDKFIKQVRAG